MAYGSIVWFISLFVVKQQIGNPGLFFTVYAIVLIIARGPIGLLSDRYGRIAVIAPGLVVGAFALGLLAMTTSMAMLLLVAGLYALSFAAIQPTLMALTVDRVPPAQRGSAMGTFSTAMDLGISAGAIVWGIVAQYAGYESVYFLAAGVNLIGLVIILQAYLPGRKGQTNTSV
jgi:MFS family permease